MVRTQRIIRGDRIRIDRPRIPGSLLSLRPADPKRDGLHFYLRPLCRISADSVPNFTSRCRQATILDSLEHTGVAGNQTTPESHAGDQHLALVDRPDNTWIKPGIHYVSAPVDQLTATILHYLNHPTERQQIINNAVELTSNHLTLKASLTRILENASHKQAGLAR